MQDTKTSVFDNSLIWFGAAISLAEILTGTYFAELGVSKALLAIVLGHTIGFVLLFLAALIGVKTKKGSMESSAFSFGLYGSKFFALLNVIQLLGWTSIMIYQGGLAASSVVPLKSYLWIIVIAAFIILWIVLGLEKIHLINKFVMAALFILCAILAIKIFGSGSVSSVESTGLTFGAALELSIAMPLSWLPLIADYTSKAESGFASSLASSAIYSIASACMYILGMFAVLCSGAFDLSEILGLMGFGVGALLIVIASTVTTTFLDAYSGGISASAISSSINPKLSASIITIIGAIAAIALVPDDFTEFLYFIGSVFAPMIAILISEFFILKNTDNNKKFSVKNTCIWFVGFLIYRLLIGLNSPIGASIPAIVIVIAISVMVHLVYKKVSHSN